MSSDCDDEFGPLPNPWPASGDREPQAELREIPSPSQPRLRSDEGFGFWMAVVWCILFFIFTQIIIGIACGFPLLFFAVFMEAAPQNGQVDANQMMKSDSVMVASLLSVMCSHVFGVLFAWLILRWQVGRQWKRKIALSRRPTLTHFVLVLIGLVAMLAVSACISAPIDKYVPSIEKILKWLGIDFPFKGAEMIADLVKANPLALALFTIGVLPAFDEEFWCRGFIAWGLSFRYPAWAVIVITSIFFGCLHVDPRQGLGAMFLGLAMHFAYRTTRSLWAPMVLHFLNNSMGVIHFYYVQTPLAVLQPLEDTLEASPVLFVGSSFLLFAAVGYALYQTRCKLVSINPSMPVWEPPSRSGVELPPAGSGTIVTHDPISPLSVCLVLIGAVAFGLVLSLA